MEPRRGSSWTFGRVRPTSESLRGTASVCTRRCAGSVAVEPRRSRNRRGRRCPPPSDPNVRQKLAGQLDPLLKDPGIRGCAGRGAEMARQRAARHERPARKLVHAEVQVQVVNDPGQEFADPCIHILRTASATGRPPRVTGATRPQEKDLLKPIGLSRPRNEATMCRHRSSTAAPPAAVRTVPSST